MDDDDARQIAAIRAWRAGQSVTAIGVRRARIDLWRAERRRRCVSLDEVAEPAHAPQLDDMIDFSRAPPILQRWAAGWTYAELGDRYGLSIGTVHARVAREIRRMRDDRSL